MCLVFVAILPIAARHCFFAPRRYSGFCVEIWLSLFCGGYHLDAGVISPSIFQITLVNVISFCGINNDLSGYLWY